MSAALAARTVAGLVLLLTTLSTAAIPALRAARADRLVSLRE
ncbi:MAG: hypothetical protein WEB88_06130 [Gemmatimonadota bacterium]